MNKAAAWIDSEIKLSEMMSVLTGASIISVDTEFIRETTFFPKIALIQVATTDHVWLIDPLKLGKIALEPLRALLVDPKVLKVMHASFGDQECFHYAYGYVVNPVLDTAVAASLMGLGDSIGLAKLLNVILRVHLAKGFARVHWMDRPLSPELLKYAGDDVAHLVKLAETMLVELETLKRREWALELSQAGIDEFGETAEETAKRMIAASSSLEPKSMGCYYELLSWRERRARETDRPRSWIADNSVLLSLAKSRPRTMDELGRFRGLNQREMKSSGQSILSAIEKGIQNPLESDNTAMSAPSQDEEQVLLLFKTFVNVLGNQHRIAPRLILGSDQLLPILRLAEKDVAQWVDSGMLAPQVAAIVGADIKNFLSGRCTLSVVAGKLAIKLGA